MQGRVCFEQPSTFLGQTTPKSLICRACDTAHGLPWLLGMELVMVEGGPGISPLFDCLGVWLRGSELLLALLSDVSVGWTSYVHCCPSSQSFRGRCSLITIIPRPTPLGAQDKQPAHPSAVLIFPHFLYSDVITLLQPLLRCGVALDWPICLLPWGCQRNVCLGSLLLGIHKNVPDMSSLS